jgi:hypothetical protein
MTGGDVMFSDPTPMLTPSMEAIPPQPVPST